MLKKVLLWFLAFLFLIQLIKIDIVKPKTIDSKAEIKTSKKIMSILKTSCYDCHSYETKMPWYGNIAPISWEVRGHINDARKWLNFQEWETYDESKKQKLYKSIYTSINFSMPIPAYVSLHKDAELTKEQREIIKKWVLSYIKNRDDIF